MPTTVPACTPGSVGTLTLGDNPIDVEPGFAAATNLEDVCFNFGAAGSGRAVFIEQCWAPASLPGFNVSINCYKGGEDNINPAANPTGVGHKEFRIFRGAEPSGDGDWGCFAPGRHGSPRDHGVQHLLHPGDAGQLQQQRRGPVHPVHAAPLTG